MTNLHLKRKQIIMSSFVLQETSESRFDFTLSSKIQELLLLNLKFRKESIIYSNNILISNKMWKFKNSKSQLQAKVEYRGIS